MSYYVENVLQGPFEVSYTELQNLVDREARRLFSPAYVILISMFFLSSAVPLTRVTGTKTVWRLNGYDNADVWILQFFCEARVQEDESYAWVRFCAVSDEPLTKLQVSEKRLIYTYMTNYNL